MALPARSRPRNGASPTFIVKPAVDQGNLDEELADISSGFGSEDLIHVNPKRIGNIQEGPQDGIPVIHSAACTAGCKFQTFSDISITRSHDSASSTPSQNSFCISNSCTPHMKDRMRRKLRYFFMNPIEKWNAKGRAPWKLALQVLKIFFVTTQLVLFGSDSSRHQELQENTEITFRQLLLKDWDSLREIESYPPATGPYAVYTKTEFYDHVDYVIHQFTMALGDAIGSYGYDTEDGSLSSMDFCKNYYKSGKIWPFNSTLDYDSNVVEKCINIPPQYPAGDKRWKNFSIKTFLIQNNFSINFDRLLTIKLKFPISTVFLKTLSSYDSPECFKFNIHVLYDNTHHDGQVVISLKTHSEKLICHSDVKYQEGDYVESIVRQVLNVIVIIFCCLSLMLCSRSLYKGQCLRKETSLFFKKVFGQELSFQDKLDFVDFWYVMIIVNDVLIILGSALKIEIEHHEVALIDSQYHIVSMLLGIGNLLVWAGVLRYLGFFDKYNLLILTLKRALPNVLRFTLCCILLYAGFCCCGWVVLGPYHIKFRHLSSTSECLFALMNGDDMFATFAITHTRSDMVWWFSRVYLYLFICLFIYVVISLFISVIMDAYETIKQYYEKGFPLSELQQFIAECNFDASSGVYRLDQKNYDFFCFSPCCRKQGYERI